MPTLQFKGKNIIWNHHLSVPYHTLEEVQELHFQPETCTEPSRSEGNLIIEGDNLIALKALLPEYAGKVKCIYIDPPYNTGNEGWIYNDKVNSPLINNWLGQTVGTDDLTRHDKWLCMMTPRLKMLRDLLSDDGAIFISIDDNEVANLKLLMDEIFGEENSLGLITRKQSSGSKNDTGNNKVITTADYLVCYCKNDFVFNSYYVESTKKFSKSDDESNFSTRALEMQGGGDTLSQRPKMGYSVYYNKKNIQILFDYDLKTNQIYKDEDKDLIANGYKCYRPRKRGNEYGIWRWGKDTFIEKFNSNLVYFDDNRIYIKERENGFVEKFPEAIFDGFLNTQGTNELKAIFEEKIFDFPKPTSLITFICKISTQKNAIILDSFAGSGTTMHAVNELNKEDGGNRKCILVQMKEDSETQPDKNICQNITRERNKLAIEKLGYKSGFKYLKVGTAIDPEQLLEGNLPTYQQFAKYIYYLGTGEHLADAQNINAQSHFVGNHGAKAFYLIYEQDFEALTRLALNLSIAEDIVKNSPNKRRVIYAPACFLDSDYMEEKQIEFVSIPYNLFERKEK